jgi:hypothetical protein
MRAMLLWPVYLAFGLIVGEGGRLDQPDSVLRDVNPGDFNWTDVCLAAASAAIAVGLVGQWRALRQLRARDLNDAPWRTALALAAGWRLGVAALLTICPIVYALEQRDLVALPDDESFVGNVLTRYVWPLAIVFALAEALRRRPAKRKGGLLSALVAAVVWAGAIGIGLNMYVSSALITFLVHVATVGVDHSLHHAPGRFEILSPSEQWGIVIVAVAAVLGTLLGGAALVRGLRPTTANRRLLAAGGVLLALGGGFAAWYRFDAFPRLSPDLASVGFSGNWLQLASGGVLAAIVAAVIAHDVAARPAHRLRPRRCRLPPSRTSRCRCCWLRAGCRHSR